MSTATTLEDKALRKVAQVRSRPSLRSQKSGALLLTSRRAKTGVCPRNGYVSSNVINNNFCGKKVGKIEEKCWENPKKEKNEKENSPKFGFSPVPFK